MADAIKVLLADGHPVVRVGVRNLLEDKDGIQVVGEVEDGDETITETLDLLPDIVVLDLAIPRLPGLEAMRAIMSGHPQIKILLLNRAIRTQHIVEALQIGARGIVLHEGIEAHLAPAIQCVHKGGYWLGQEKVKGLVASLHSLVKQRASPEHRTHGLTRRQVQMIRCIVDGRSNREIAAQLDLSEETVKRHLSNVFEKLGVANRLELALFALTNHLVTPKG